MLNGLNLPFTQLFNLLWACLGNPKSRVLNILPRSMQVMWRVIRPMAHPGLAVTWLEWNGEGCPGKLKAVQMRSDFLSLRASESETWLSCLNWIPVQVNQCMYKKKPAASQCECPACLHWHYQLPVKIMCASSYRLQRMGCHSHRVPRKSTIRSYTCDYVQSALSLISFMYTADRVSYSSFVQLTLSLISVNMNSHPCLLYKLIACYFF